MPQPRPEYPRPRLRRLRWTNLNGEWEFAAGEGAGFDHRINVPFCPQSSLSGVGHLYEDVVWYRRRIHLRRAGPLYLHFGAVDYRATVWLNDIEVARHEGGHTPFSAEVSAAVREGENVIAVRAEDPLADRTIPRGKQYWKETPEGIFYTPTSGIWQTVWLEPVPERHIRDLSLQPDLDAGAIDAVVDADGQLELTARLAGRVVGRWSGGGRARIDLDEVVSWSPDSPTLYDLEVRLLDPGGHETDRVESYFGLRKVATAEGCVLLNGMPYVQRLVLDQGYFAGGLMTAPRDADLRRDIELAKRLGFNGARKHQKIEDPRWLYWADRLGYLVWSEMPSFHAYSPQAEERLSTEWTAAVERDRSHPCVVAWVPNNESFGVNAIDEAARARFITRLSQSTRALDGTRPVVSNDGWEHTLTDLCTLHDYGAPVELSQRYRALETALAPAARPKGAYLPGYAYHGEPVLLTEFGGLKLGASHGWGYEVVPDTEAFVEAYRALFDALMGPGPVTGLCYTQLTDIEQEQNGLLTAERVPKIDAGVIRSITQMPKAR